MDEPTRSLRATAHPLRLRILSLLTGADLSAAEIARELGVTHANASYHLRLLARAGEVVVSGEEKVRGGVAKRYRHRWREVAAQEAGQPGTRSLDVRALAQELVRRHALRAPEHGRGYYCDAELWVDDDVWSQVLALVEQAGALVHDAARPPRTEGTRRVNLSIAAFGMQP